MSEETRRLGLTALGRLASIEDIVGAAVFLASDASRHITGASIHACASSRDHRDLAVKPGLRPTPPSWR